MTTKTVVVLSGTTWTVPADWNNADNSIEAIGGGGGGGVGSAGGSEGAGGGAAYAKETNVTLTPGGTIDIQIGVGGQAGTVAPTATWAKNAVGGTKVVEAAPGGNRSSGTGGAGGTAAASIGSIKYSGGAGGNGTGRAGPGGGGSAGPNGDGKSGGNGLGGTAAGGGGGGGSNGASATAGAAATNANGGAGGAGTAGTGGGAGGTTGVGGNGTGGGGGGGGWMDVGGNVGYAGGTGSQHLIWTDTVSGLQYGPAGGGGGGGGHNTSPAAGDGGTAQYGGGGGAGGSAVGSGGTQGARGHGGPGILVFTYTVAAASSDLSGNVTLDAVAPAGTLADAGASGMSGNVTIDAIAPSGTLGLEPGTVTVPALRNWSGSLQTSVTIPVVTVMTLSTGAQVLALTDQTTDGTTANLAITSTSLVVGTTYMVAGWNADGLQRFAAPITAA